MSEAVVFERRTSNIERRTLKLRGLVVLFLPTDCTDGEGWIFGGFGCVVLLPAKWHEESRRGLGEELCSIED